MGREPELLNGRPCDLSGCAESTDPSLSFRPLRLRHTIEGGYMRSIALDVHREFCEVAIKDGGEVRSAGRIKTSAEELELFAQSLAPDDQVALEATGPALRIKRLIEPHVARVVIANTRKLRAIAEAKVKTDRVDARTLCELLAADFLPEVFGPTRQPGRSGAASLAAPRSFASAPGQRTSSTRCSPETSRVAHR